MFATRQGSSRLGAAGRSVGRTVAAAALVAAFGAALAQVQAPRDDLGHLSVDDLKRGYLACHQASTRRVLGMGEAMQCSVVYEALKKRAFGGDFDRLLAWTRAQAPRATGGETGSASASSCPEDL